VGHPFDKREYPRLPETFKVAIGKIDQPSEIEGVTHDLSQGGSLILTSQWHDFTPGEVAELRFFLPPDFTGQQVITVVLRGTGVVRRLDAGRNGIAIEFFRSFRTFDPSWEVGE
jgi:hypothetical protein